jgi:hypothetical protein
VQSRMGKNAKKGLTDGSATSSNDTNLILRAIENTMQTLSDRFDKQEESILKMKHIFDELVGRFNEQQQVVMKLSEDNKLLLEENEAFKKTHHFLSSEINILKSKMNEIQQEKINNEVLITHLPINSEIDVEVLTDKLVKLFCCDSRNIIKKQSILNNKTGAKQNYHHISLTFKDDISKQSFLSKKKQHGPIFWKQFFPGSMMTDDNNNFQIYINEKLTIDNLQLLREAKKMCKSGKLMFAWSQRGSVLARKSDGGIIHKLRLSEDLEALCKVSIVDLDDCKNE